MSRAAQAAKILKKQGWLVKFPGLTDQAVLGAVTNVIMDVYGEKEVAPETLAIPVIRGFRSEEDDE